MIILEQIGSNSGVIALNFGPNSRLFGQKIQRTSNAI